MARQVVGAKMRKYRKHNWDLWAKGGVWEIKQSEIDRKLKGLRVALYTTATELGLGVHTSLINDVLRFEFYDPIKEAEETNAAVNCDRPDCPQNVAVVQLAPEPPSCLSSFCDKFKAVDSLAMSYLSYVDGL